MRKRQSFNPRTRRWVEYKKYKDGECKITRVKKNNPTEPFRGTRIHRSRRRVR